MPPKRPRSTRNTKRAVNAITHRDRHTSRTRPFQPDPSFPLELEIQALSHKLRNADRIAARIAAEGAEVDLPRYFARLRKRKTSLLARARSFDADRAKRTAQSVGGTQSIIRAQMAPPGVSVPPRASRPGDSLLSAALDTVAVPLCKSFEGRVAPRETFTVESRISINHNSKASASFNDSSFDSNGTFTAKVSLDDDASFWRDDNPDVFGFTYDVVWDLPTRPCDYLAVCTFLSGQRLSFTNGADDGARCISWIQFNSTDPTGAWFPRTEDPFNDGIIVYDGTRSGTETSGDRLLSLAFLINAGVTGKVALRHGVALRAQDGRVTADMVVEVGPPTGLGGPPQIAYNMDPLP